MRAAVFLLMLLCLSACPLFAAEEPVAKKPGFLPDVRPGFGATAEAEKFKAVCETVHLESDADIPVGDMERRLLCGDSRSDAIGTPWGQIPPNQAAFFMRSFLQSKGYHKPSFIQDGHTLFVRAGPRAELKRFLIEGGPPTWDPPKRRLIIGLPLTPELLNDLQAWSLGQVRNEGYACATAETRADPESGEVKVFLTPGDLKHVIAIDDRGDTGLKEGILDRYNAFSIGDTYNEQLVTLTRRRVIADGILQTMTLRAECTDEGVRLVRDVTLGSARLLRVGFGGSTETGARVRVIARQARVGDTASSLEARFDVSFVQQTFEGNARWYYANGAKRNYLEPSFIVNRQKETAFEAQSATTKLLHGWGWEFATGQLDFRAGPNLLFSQSVLGTGPAHSTVFLIETTSRWISHDYEFFTSSPRSGSFLEASAFFTQKSWGANFTAQKLQLQGEKLWNIFRYDPPLLILGIRFNVSSVFSPDENITADLPVQFLSFAGGETSLRGFERQSLPRSGVGALSGAVGGVEARLHRVLFRRADAFVFNDVGALGGARFRLERPIFISPGVGVRWESPIGVFRAYAARRVALMPNEADEPYHAAWRLGLTYGEEF